MTFSTFPYSGIDDSWNGMEFTISGFGQINEKKDFFPKLGYAQKCKKIKSDMLQCCIILI